MMDFVILKTVTDELRKRIEKKKVCNVVEYILLSHAGPYKGWLGSVEDEYFSITFVKGIVSISLDEREMRLGWTINNYGMVEHLHKILVSKNIKFETIQKLADAYNLIGADHDTMNITFHDVMKVFNWKFKSRKVKVEEHFLNDSSLIHVPSKPLTYPEIVI
jgi:hypothetical protein